MASVIGPRLWLALALALIARANTQSVIPTCAHLTVQIRSSKGKVAIGEKVRLTVSVLNTGTTAIDAINVGLSSSMLASWRSPLSNKVPARVSGNSVFWLDQNLRSAKRVFYQMKAGMCSDAISGQQSIASAMVYRLNATGGVACMTTVDSDAVSQYGGGVQVVEC